ncbi:MAG: hypothetical protein JO255_09050 [Alphaproteobacteria bacterium]|nr:hypothetical protein [Alphaproteobacteria bacterium]
MTFDLRAVLPHLLPKAIAWAEQRVDEVLRAGAALDDLSLSIARSVGVARPELIRLSPVSEMPFPLDPALREAAMATGFLGVDTTGLTLGHAVLIRQGHDSVRLRSHECRHVAQYEEAGSIAAFLPVYLGQIVQHGYAAAPLELDARRHEIEV